MRPNSLSHRYFICCPSKITEHIEKVTRMCFFDYGQNKGIKKISHLDFVIFVKFSLYLEGKKEPKVTAQYKMNFSNAS